MKTDGTKKKNASKAPRPSQPQNRHDKPAPIEAPKTPTEPDVFDEPPMSLSMAPRPRRLSWSYSLLSEVDAATMEDLVVAAGTKVAVEGSIDRLGYLYVVQVGEDKSVEVLFPSHGGSRRARPGMDLRLPSGTGWITTTKKGKLRTITSPYPLTDQQIFELL